MTEVLEKRKIKLILMAFTADDQNLKSHFKSLAIEPKQIQEKNQALVSIYVNSESYSQELHYTLAEMSITKVCESKKDYMNLC